MELIDKLQWLAIFLFGGMVVWQAGRIDYLEKVIHAISIVLISEHDINFEDDKQD